MRNHKQAFLCMICMIFVLLLVVGNAYPAVTVLSRTSSAWALNDKGGSGTLVTWNEYSAYAWQNTTISGNTIYADGGAVDSIPRIHPYYSEGVTQSAGSSVKIEFNVSNPEYFLLDLSVNADVDFGGFYSPDITHLQISLFGDNGSIFDFNFFDELIKGGTSWYTWNEQFSESYLLDSGNYTLIAEATAGGSYGGAGEFFADVPMEGGGGWANYELQISTFNPASDFHVIPTPSAIVLAGIGMSMVGWLRRRRVV